MVCAKKLQNIKAKIYLDNHKFNQVEEFPYPEITYMITADDRITQEIR